MPRPKKNPIVEGEIATEPVIEKTTPRMETITNEPVVEKKEPAKKEDKVEMSRADFDKLMSTLEKQTKDIDLLYKVSDKSRLAREYNREGENLIKQCGVRLWDNTGLLVIGSKLLTNRCEVVMGRWIEEQNMSIVLEDGQVIEMPYLEYVRKTIHKKMADIIGKQEETDSSGNKVQLFKLQFADGKVLLINSNFVN